MPSHQMGAMHTDFKTESSNGDPNPHWCKWPAVSLQMAGLGGQEPAIENVSSLKIVRFKEEKAQNLKLYSRKYEATKCSCQADHAAKRSKFCEEVLRQKQVIWEQPL